MTTCTCVTRVVCAVWTVLALSACEPGAGGAAADATEFGAGTGSYGQDDAKKPPVFGSPPERERADAPQDGATGSDDPPSGESTPTGPLVCGDGVCMEGEPESCFIDCVDPKEDTTQSGQEDSSSGSAEPAEPPAAPPSSPPASPPNSPSEESDSDHWQCVSQQCAMEWQACMMDSGCANLHQCMMSCSGDDLCQSSCMASAPQLSVFLLEDMAICAHALGCM